jgi:drug/metabolite transporter (DMT)-like permease
MGGNGIEASMAKLPGVAMVLGGALAFALGIIMAKRLPVALPLIASAALQIGIGSAPVALAGWLFERLRFEALSTLGWALMAYTTIIGFGVAYVAWFAAAAAGIGGRGRHHDGAGDRRGRLGDRAA